jgi:hypothetical protein
MKSLAFRPRLGVAFLLVPVALGSKVALAPAAPATADAQSQKVTRRVEQLLRGVIKSSNGTPIALKVTPGARSAQGLFPHITISGGSTQIKNLFASEFALDAQNVQVDVPSLWSVGKVRTTRSQTRLRVVITEADLTKMLSRGKSTKSMGLSVKYVGDKMRITGNLNYGLVNGPVSGLAKLRQTSDHNVYLDILSLKLRGVEAPGFVINQLSNRINPVINYSTLPFNPPFRHLRVVGNKAILST